MLDKLKKFFDIPDNHYTVRQIFRWLWEALQGNRLQAILNAVVGLLGVALGLASREEIETIKSLSFRINDLLKTFWQDEYFLFLLLSSLHFHLIQSKNYYRIEERPG